MKNQNIRRKDQGITWVEIVITIAIISVLVVLFFPAAGRPSNAGWRIVSVNKVKNIVLGMREYSAENDGFFPSAISENGEVFTSSVEVFNLLIPNFLNTEQNFWVKTDDKPTVPNENNLLIADECIYGYVAGQTEKDCALSPLVFEGFMDTSGRVTADHIWLKDRKLVVGYVDGHVEQNQLTSKSAGATVQSTDLKVDNIFEKRIIGEDGTASGGYLSEGATILLPHSD